MDILILTHETKQCDNSKNLNNIIVIVILKTSLFTYENSNFYHR